LEYWSTDCKIARRRCVDDVDTSRIW
jgi:hypothetical protein